MRHDVKHKLLSARDNWGEMEFADRITYLWEIPIDFLRDLTIPCTDEVFFNNLQIIIFNTNFYFFLQQ